MSEFVAVLKIETQDKLTEDQFNELKTDLDKLDHEKYEIILKTAQNHYRNTTGVWESKTRGSYYI